MEPPSTSPGQTSMILDDIQAGRLRRTLRNFHMHCKEFNGKTIIIHNLVNIFKEIVFGLRRKQIPVSHVYLVGGAASYVANIMYLYNDIDVLFKIETGNEPDEVEERRILDEVKEVIFGVLRNLLRKARLDHFNDALRDCYIAKKSLVFDATTKDSWSLIAFNNRNGDNLEIKTSIRMRREFQFATDALQIDLMPLIDNINAPIRMISSFGNIHQTTSLIHWRQIETRNPEEIIGGGLFKYCLLKANGFNDSPNKIRRNQLRRGILDAFVAHWREDAYNPVSEFMRNHFKAHDVEQKRFFLLNLESFLNGMPPNICSRVRGEIHWLRSIITPRAVYYQGPAVFQGFNG